MSYIYVYVGDRYHCVHANVCMRMSLCSLNGHRKYSIVSLFVCGFPLCVVCIVLYIDVCCRVSPHVVCG